MVAKGADYICPNNGYNETISVALYNTTIFASGRMCKPDQADKVLLIEKRMKHFLITCEADSLARCCW